MDDDNDDDDDDDDDDDSDERESRPRGVIDLLMPFPEKAAEVMPGLVMSKVMPSSQTQERAALPASDAAPTSDEDLVNRPAFEARDLVDLRYAKRNGDAKRAAKQRAQGSGAPGSVAALQARIMSDPALVQHLMAIKQLLTGEEIEKLMTMVGHTSEEQQTQFIDMIKQLPADQAAEFCRDVIGSIDAKEA